MRVLGADEHIVAVGNNYTKIFMCFAPMFMCNYVANAFVRNDGAPEIAMLATLLAVCLILYLITSLCFL